MQIQRPVATSSFNNIFVILFVVCLLNEVLLSSSLELKAVVFGLRAADFEMITAQGIFRPSNLTGRTCEESQNKSHVSQAWI